MLADNQKSPDSEIGGVVSQALRIEYHKSLDLWVVMIKGEKLFEGTKDQCIRYIKEF
jgi:hypothetical protein